MWEELELKIALLAESCGKKFIRLESNDIVVRDIGATVGQYQTVLDADYWQNKITDNESKAG